jgi:hypothetical protein
MLEICNLDVFNFLIKKYKTHLKGSRYEGEFANDKFNGRGVLILKEGGYYNGTWVDAKRNGQGELLYKNGDKYSGEWKDDKRNGRGILTVAKTGQVLNGLWANDALIGQEK